jgi:hypothetical protein
MLSDKKATPILKHNPGVMIGKEEMTKYIDFVSAISKKNEIPYVEQAKPL